MGTVSRTQRAAERAAESMITGSDPQYKWPRLPWCVRMPEYDSNGVATYWDQDNSRHFRTRAEAESFVAYMASGVYNDFEEWLIATPSQRAEMIATADAADWAAEHGY